MSISQIIQQITENNLSELQESVDIECKLSLLVEEMVKENYLIVFGIAIVRLPIPMAV